MKKLLLVITKSNWGGAQKYVYDIATSLDGNGYDVLVASGGHGEMLAKCMQSGVPTHTLHKLKNNMNPLGSILAFIELIQLFNREKPDIVHINSSKVGLLGSIAARIAGVPKIVFTAHGWPFNEERPTWQRNILKTLMKITVFCSHVTICVSEKTKADLKSFPWLMKKCHVIHNGIAPISFKSTTAFYEECRIMRKEKIAMVSIGELHPSKGFDLALSYLKELKDLSWEWFILGEGKERATLEKAVQEYGLTERVHLIGHTKNAADYLESFDVFFLPSRTEALAYVALEALQTDLPIIASKVGGIPEVLTDDPGSILVNINSSETKDALQKILSSPAQKIRGSDRDSLRKKFSLEDMLSKTTEVYRK